MQIGKTKVQQNSMVYGWIDDGHRSCLECHRVNGHLAAELMAIAFSFRFGVVMLLFGCTQYVEESRHGSFLCFEQRVCFFEKYLELLGCEKMWRERQG
jgi:hypothetical protein